MLPARNRVRRSSEFAAVLRTGRRVGGRLIVVHQMAHAGPRSGPGVAAGDIEVARVGFVVSKAVGGSVVRSRVSRRLRAQCAIRLTQMPAGSLTVVRALPAAGTASSQALGAALDRAFARLATGTRATASTPR